VWVGAGVHETMGPEGGDVARRGVGVGVKTGSWRRFQGDWQRSGAVDCRMKALGCRLGPAEGVQRGASRVTWPGAVSLNKGRGGVLGSMQGNAGPCWLECECRGVRECLQRGMNKKKIACTAAIGEAEKSRLARTSLKK
jgi:hypothetical protein